MTLLWFHVTLGALCSQYCHQMAMNVFGLSKPELTAWHLCVPPFLFSGGSVLHSYIPGFSSELWLWRSHLASHLEEEFLSAYRPLEGPGAEEGHRTWRRMVPLAHMNPTPHHTCSGTVLKVKVLSLEDSIAVCSRETLFQKAQAADVLRCQWADMHNLAPADKGEPKGPINVQTGSSACTEITRLCDLVSRYMFLEK